MNTHTFFHLAELNEYICYDFLEDISINNKSYNLLKYLHGYCDNFAVYMAKRFGYNICLWTQYDYDIEKIALVHAFNSCVVNEKTYYIDIRGVTSNIENIYSDFEDFCDEDNICMQSFSNIEEAKKSLESILLLPKYKINSEQYVEMQTIVDTFLNMYKIENIINNLY